MKLRPFLILVCLVFSVVLASAEEIIIDNDDGPPGYTSSGDWQLSSNTGYNDGQYWYVSRTASPSAATWTPEIQIPDFYAVEAIFRRAGDRPDSAPYTIVHASGTTVVHVDQQGAFVMDEVFLGDYYFNAGTSGYVRLDNSGSSGNYISDAFRFRIAEDDPPVISEITQTPGYPQASDDVVVTARITDDRGIVSATLEYSVSPSGLNDIVPMADDGASGDGAAGDSIFGGTIPVQADGETVTYTVSALDNGGHLTTSPSNEYLVGQEAPREYRVIWVDSWDWPGSKSFLTPQDADELVQTCRDHNINTIMIQVTKIGDAAFESNISPRATNIPDDDFDPLAYLLEIAHDTSDGKPYIHIHAWFVMQRIDTTSANMRDHPDHVLNRHPEYVMLDRDGNDSGGGRIFLDPGHPGSVEFNLDVILDCMENYAIDGVNLDYIRYPEASGDWGYNPTSVARFNAAFGRTGLPTGNDPDWEAWRRLLVTNQVKKIYIRMMQKNPDVILTADTINWGLTGFNNYPNSSPYRGVFQDWRGWLLEGIIDYNALMNYAPLTQPGRYEGWTDFSLAHDGLRGSIIGIGAYLHTNVQGSIDQLLYARNQGAAGLNIYDWYSEVSANSQGETRADFFREVKEQVFTRWVEPPDAEWKTNPTTGVFEGTLTDGGNPIDYGVVMIEGEPDTAVYTDGSGWFGMLEVPPGQHILVFSKTGYSDLTVPAAIPSAGDIVTIHADFSNKTGVLEMY